jgi:hypothetical protein
MTDHASEPKPSATESIDILLEMAEDAGLTSVKIPVSLLKHIRERIAKLELVIETNQALMRDVY